MENIEKIKEDFNNYVQKTNPFYKDNIPFLLQKFLVAVSFYLIIPVYIGNKILDCISFHRDFIPKNIKKVKMPPELTIDFLATEEIKYKYEATIQREITKFMATLTTHFKAEDLAIFYRNLRTLNFKKMKTKEYNAIGIYNARNNKISFVNGVNSNTIFHELFHMASSYLDKENKILYGGFYQSSKGLNIGRGLDEGYTELLANRYSNASDSLCYICEKICAERIEKIVGQEKMQSLYLHANLNGLIQELSQYQSTDKIMQFLQNMDIWEKYKNTADKEKKLDNCLYNIEYFLIETYLIKTERQLNDLSFSNRESLEKYLQSVRSNIYNMVCFSTISVEVLDEVMENILGNTITIKKQQIEKIEMTEMEARRKAALAKDLAKLETLKSINFTASPVKPAPIADFNFETGEMIYKDDSNIRIGL